MIEKELKEIKNKLITKLGETSYEAAQPAEPSKNVF